ncbi:MAG: endonuclease MutS2 [Thermodesulfobacteriota bacterium]
MISENALERLEFPKFLRLVSDLSHCPSTKQSVLQIRPFENLADIEQRQGLIEEIRKLSALGRPLQFFPFDDLRPFLEKVRPAGAVLEPLELASFIPVLQLSKSISLQIKEAEAAPLLKNMVQAIGGFPELSASLERALDPEGNVLDRASTLLVELRQEIRHLEAQIRKKLEEILRESRVAPFLQDDFVTQRSGRWVVPVRMDSKNQIPGVVHDLSRTGETAFVEPLQIIGPANQLGNLMAEEKAEVIRILRELSTMVRKRADEIEKELAILVHLDLLQGLAHMADRLKMERPEVREGNRIQLIKARHPLLAISFQTRGQQKTVVPLTFELGEENRVMVITGVNAGGKTIALKTTGLLLLMALSGLPVPAESSSVFPLLDELLVDIGDEQSIESSLSTFSAHISRITGILNRADEKALVLMDEMGTSTDPLEGAAIACAVLKDLQDKGALILATTHLTEIKGFVHRTEGMVNASMEFDQKTLTPLYRMLMGEPGQSHAIEIARQYGLPEKILETALRLLSGREEGFEKLVADLNQKRRDYEQGLEELKNLKEEAAEENRKRESLLAEAQTRQKEILAAAYTEALEIASRTKREMNLFLEEMKKKDKAERKRVLHKLREEEAALSGKLRQIRGEGEDAPIIESLTPGDRVFVRSLKGKAEVVEVLLKHNRVKVRAEGREIEVPVSDLGLGGKDHFPVKTGSVGTSISRESIPSRLQLIGRRVDDALSELEPFLNHASLAGLQEIVIIHGIGTGILARAVRDYLKSHPLAKNFRKGDSSEGGEGVTVVRLE